MDVLRWTDTDRQRLGAVLGESLVVLGVGAVEQHGPHLPSGTDTLLAGTVVDEAVRLAGPRSARDLVVAPTVPIGASDHHFPFGATLSVTVPTMTAVLCEIARSVAVDGGRRLVIVNGHGGNTGPCAAAAAMASTGHGLAVAHLDYWDLLGDAPAGAAVPGHAGEFETSMVLALRPEAVHGPPSRTSAPSGLMSDPLPGVGIKSQHEWRAIDGYTDDPSRADAATGVRLLAACAGALADRLVDLAASL